MTRTKKILLSILLLTAIGAGGYHLNRLYTHLDNQKIKVAVGDCLARGENPKRADYYMQILVVEPESKRITYVMVNIGQKTAGLYSSLNYEFNKTAKKEDFYFVNCKDFNILSSF